MKKVTLVFPSIQALWRFRDRIKTNTVEIIATRRTIICECSDGEVQVAIQEYGAKVEEGETYRNN